MFSEHDKKQISTNTWHSCFSWLSLKRWLLDKSHKIYLTVVIVKVKMKVKLLSCVWLSATPWTVACKAPPSMGIFRQENWSGLPFLLHGIFLTQGSNLGLPHCRQMLYHLSHQGSPLFYKSSHYSESITIVWLNFPFLKLLINGII